MSKQREQSLEIQKAALEKALAAKSLQLQRKNRLLEIEAALDQVRAQMMRMQCSDELVETTEGMLAQFKALDILPRDAVLLVSLIDARKATARHWATKEDNLESPEHHHIPLDEHPLLIDTFAAWKRKDPLIVRDLAGDELDDFLRYLLSLPALEGSIARSMWSPIPPRLVWSEASFSHGLLSILSNEPLSESTQDILGRFARVFDLTYTRFLDLQKAEAQAREAQIEAALERVRSKALAMQSSNDLIDIANELREQMGNLGQPELESSIVHLYQDAKDTFEAWWAFRSPDRPTRQVLSGYAHIPIDACEYTRETIAKYKSSASEYVIESRGQKLFDWYKTLEKVAPQTVDYDEDGQIILPEVLYYHHCKFSGGALLMISNDMPTDEVRTLQKRTAKVFDFAYRRFLDLQKAEEQAREAVRQASLDRVRGEIASMRTPDDLQRITPLIWRELNTLGVPFFRCGVFIMDDRQKKVHAFLSTPHGKPLAAMDVPYDHSDFVSASLEHWRQKKIYKDEWDKEKFVQWTKSILDRGLIRNPGQYQAGENPPDRLVLQYVPFTQGMLYVGSRDHLNDEQIQLVKDLAEAFSVAYARYEDFSQLEAAKESIERTLSELKEAQQQLIHAEKMASLGELTAGIAHEIQNPLNFVNNFSELSGELLQEAQEELEKGDLSEAKEIIVGLFQNLEKISHHGKRASSIVRGMLDHSRTSTGEKVPTDINYLCDEYLRLAYHGMRARNKSFNATTETLFDESLDKVEIVPQEIGRVLLNLVTNAFHAVMEKANVQNDGYQPKVSVKTRQSNGMLKIMVGDNGPGIPKKNMDKIFQPFFTTKSTGQGTGLGLSLSYDIVLAHGGELTVESQEGEGTVFSINIPI